MVVRNELKKQKSDINLYGFVNNKPLNYIDFLGLCSKKCPYCPDGEWSSFSKLAVSAFFGGGGTLARTKYTCKANKKVCRATAVCFGGGAIAAIGAGPDGGGFTGVKRGVVDTFCPSDLKKFSSGIYITAGPISITETGSSTNAGLGKSVGLGVAYVTCKNFLIICDD